MSKRLKLFAAGIALALVAVPARAAIRETPTCPLVRTDDTWTQFRQGDEFKRREAVLFITTEARKTNPSYEAIRKCADQLQLYYDARAGRQQTFLNTGTLIVLLGTTGAALSAGAGTVTQGYWTGAAVAPTILAQFYANEPTRDLFHSGATTLNFMGRRYDEVLRITAKLADGGSSTPAPKEGFSEGCEGLRKAAGITFGWPDNADRAALQPEVDRLLASCATAEERHEVLETFQHSATAWSAEIARLYGDDIAGLDAQLRVQDRALRYSPMQALSAVLASPFLTIGSVLSSENAKGAVEALKAQAAIQSLKVPIAPVPVTTAPELAVAPPPVAASARLRSAAPRANDSKPPKEDVDKVLAALEEARRRLVLEAPIFNERAGLARQISLAARTWSISPRFDPQTRAIRLVLTNDGGMFEVSPPQ